MSEYLRVHKWRDHQHYTDRRPPWIKLLRRLIEHDRDFQEKLSEPEQWQLVRLWLYASGSDTVMLDAEGRETPLMVNDENNLRLGIRSLKPIPLKKLIQQGWLEVVTDADIAASFEAHSDPLVASTIASALASAGASTGSPDSGVTTPTEKTEAAEVTERGSTAFIGEPVEVLIAHIKDGDANTARTIRSFTDRLPPAAFAQTLAQLRTRRPRSQARYAVATLKKMVSEGQYVRRETA